MGEQRLSEVSAEDTERQATAALTAPEDPASFHTAIAHLHRAEMQRMTVWRQRLDTTTHWAIILTTGITSFVLGSQNVPHYAVLLALAFNSLFMLLEGRRYQHLHHSKWRLELLEGNYFAGQLTHCRPAKLDWRRLLSTDLQQPHFTITFGMGVRLRLRRNYLILAYLTLGVWITKVFIHPASPRGWSELYQRFAVGGLLPSWFVLSSALLFMVVLTVATFVTPSQEALEHWTAAQHARRVGASDDDERPG
ncbi:MAG: DUF2270 domain-containing protein [Deltaproteobacteria bacterium]|nr:DUF2270 domain-containing protein [Deltaproteobacteria bacterium]